MISGARWPCGSWVPTAVSAQAANLEEVGTLHGVFGDLVDDEGHVRVRCTLWYFALPPMLNPAMSMVPSVGLYVNPERFDLGEPVRPQGGQVTTVLAGEEAHFGVTEGHVKQV